ncbi:MAG TPA: hypothetical protein DCY70_21185 [Shewanella sp.]|nr:hypothetical protein [Shewanella sp.]
MPRTHALETVISSPSLPSFLLKSLKQNICYKLNTKSMEPLVRYMLNSHIKLNLMVLAARRLQFFLEIQGHHHANIHNNIDLTGNK